MQGNKKVLEGIVTSDKMNKTRVVQVTSRKKHSFYDKIVKVNKKYKVHDEENESQQGDKVRIIETRPLSKDKRYTLVKVIEKRKLG